MERQVSWLPLKTVRNSPHVPWSSPNRLNCVRDLVYKAMNGHRPFSPKNRCMISTESCISSCSHIRTETPPLLVFSDDWGRHPSSCQHLIRRLRQDFPVLWVNTIGTRQPKANSFT